MSHTITRITDGFLAGSACLVTSSAMAQDAVPQIDAPINPIVTQLIIPIITGLIVPFLKELVLTMRQRRKERREQHKNDSK